jgi:hypothetical protein
MNLERTRRLLQDGFDRADPIGGLIDVLEAADMLVALPDNDFRGSLWENTQEARAELRRLIDAVQGGALPDRVTYGVLFAPTGPLQEVSVRSEWGEAFLRLAERYDEVEALLWPLPGDAAPAMGTPHFGCPLCWPSSPESAWARRPTLERGLRLIDESHFDVVLLRCPVCGQVFVSLWTERIDWAGGADPQSWTLLPLTAEEALGLAGGGPPVEAALERLGPDRRSLRRERPSDGAHRLFWGRGILVGRHD